MYGAQNLFVGFRMSAYEQIRNRLSSNGKVTQEANVFSKSFIKEGLIVNFDRQNIFQDKNGFTLWKKVVAGMSAGGKFPISACTSIAWNLV